MACGSAHSARGALQRKQAPRLAKLWVLQSLQYQSPSRNEGWGLQGGGRGVWRARGGEEMKHAQAAQQARLQDKQSRLG